MKRVFIAIALVCGMNVKAQDSTTNTHDGFKTFGASYNIDRNIGDRFAWRTEIKTLSSKDAVFVKPNTTATTGNTVLTTSFAVAF